MTLTAKNLVLREFVLTDLTSVHRYASDKEMTEFMDWGPDSEEDTKVFLNLQL
jgi:ribosomal-protein-alanine N-acetyltransferase